MDVESGDAQRLLKGGAQALGGVGGVSSATRSANSSWLDPGGDGVARRRRRPGASRAPPAPGRRGRGRGPRSAGEDDRGRRPPRSGRHGSPAVRVPAPQRLRRSRRPVRASCSDAAKRAPLGAARPAALTPPSSSQTPRQMQVWALRIRRRPAIVVPGGCGRSRSSMTSRSCGRASAARAAAEHSGARGPSPRARAAHHAQPVAVRAPRSTARASAANPAALPARPSHPRGSVPTLLAAFTPASRAKLALSISRRGEDVPPARHPEKKMISAKN